MKHKELLIKLIQQDLKHHQLILGLSKIGLEGRDQHSLRILEIVSKLMQVPKAVAAEWDSTYIHCMEEAVNYKVSEKEEELRALAEVCYKKLESLI